MSEIISFSNLTIDKIKKNDLKQIFEILMILPGNRTIADLNTLTKIVLNVKKIFHIDRLNPSNKSRTFQRFITAASQCIWQNSKKKTLSSRKRMIQKHCIQFLMVRWDCINVRLNNMSHRRLSFWMRVVVLASCSIGRLSFYLQYCNRL